MFMIAIAHDVTLTEGGATLNSTAARRRKASQPRRLAAAPRGGVNVWNVCSVGSSKTLPMTEDRSDQGPKWMHTLLTIACAPGNLPVVYFCSDRLIGYR